MTQHNLKQQTVTESESRLSPWVTQVTWRTHPTVADIEQVRQLTTNSGLFEPEEIRMAALAVLGTLQGENDNQYLFVEINGCVVGYASYSKIPITEGRYMLLWLAVDGIYQGSGLGRALVAEVERRLLVCGGSRFYAETSGKDGYANTRKFYEKTGFDCVAVYPDFYRDGDDKVVYCRKIGG